MSTSLGGRSFALGSTGMKKVRKTISIFLTLNTTTRPKARFENSNVKMVLLQLILK